MAQSDEKSQVDDVKESRPSENRVDTLVEYEPSSIYEVKWRTLLAVFALSLSNVCAALANTVRQPSPYATLASESSRQTQ
jgi:hypothetical protein